MKSFVALLVLALVATTAVALNSRPTGFIPNQYIAVFRPEVTAMQRNQFLNNFMASSEAHTTLATWDYAQFRGAALQMSETVAASLSKSPLLKHFIQDSHVYINQEFCQRQAQATWGLNRVSERDLVLDGIYDYDQTGNGVDAYIIDTGIMVTHNDFRGPTASRAVWGANFVDTNNVDCNGHGTHVAGTVGGTQWGIAKNVTLIAVKVLGCAGSGTWAGIINGLAWVATQKAARGRPSVSNMSLGGGLNPAVNDAVANLAAAGVIVVVAAGNERTDACTRSPASTPEAITVGATQLSTDGFGDQSDKRSDFSNYGTCTTIFAPGTSITSAWIGSNSATNTISGTSMAAPHVCGAAALYVAQHPSASQDEVKNALVAESTNDMIDLNCGTNAVCANTENKLLYSGCLNRK